MLRRFSLPVWLVTKRSFAAEHARDKMRTTLHALCDRVLRTLDNVPVDSLSAWKDRNKPSAVSHDKASSELALASLPTSPRIYFTILLLNSELGPGDGC